MDVYRQYEQTVTAWSAGLDPWRSALYALAVCRRVLPLYREWVRGGAAADPAAFHLARRLLRERLAGASSDAAAVSACRARLEAATPSTEEDPAAVYACDAGIVYLYALQLLDAHDPDCARYAARYCYEIADAATWAIIQPEGGVVTAELERRAEAHPLIQAEVRWQELGRAWLGAVPVCELAEAGRFLRAWCREPVLGASLA